MIEFIHLIFDYICYTLYYMYFPRSKLNYGNCYELTQNVSFIEVLLSTISLSISIFL